ncbi:hypothetical protein ACFYT4_29320 [Streptomyces sp. NPDC004609]|uniref:hypothetical protein n=1 Tax=Streptomyces sp. NPDC004609 TaxID=3364704 RepID=UPI0036CC12BF
MTAQDEESPLADEEFECSIELGPGWVDMTLRTGTTAEAEALAGQIVGLRGARAMTIDKGAFFADLVERAVRLNDGGPIMAAVCYAENGEALADFVIDSYREEGPTRPRRAEVHTLLLNWAGVETTGENEVTYPDLPSGPAVRVRSKVRTKQMLGLWHQDSGTVRYAVAPPGLRSLIVVTANWQNMDRSDEIAWLVDELMLTLQVTILEAHGDPVPAA